MLKDNEVRKLGGQTLYLVPLTPELKQTVLNCLGKLKAPNADRGRILSEFRTALWKEGRKLLTTADGKFEVKVQPDSYVLYTWSISVEDKQFIWVEVIDATKDVTLALKKDRFEYTLELWDDLLLRRLEIRWGPVTPATP